MSALDAGQSDAADQPPIPLLQWAIEPDDHGACMAERLKTGLSAVQNGIAAKVNSIPGLPTPRSVKSLTPTR